MDAPVRPLRTSRRCLTGRVALAQGGAASFESSLERDWLLILDFDPQAKDIRVQPFTLHYQLAGSPRRYTPDVSAEFHSPDGTRRRVIYEVKPLEVLRRQWTDLRPRLVAANHHCRESGWRFKIVTEKHIRTPFLENIRFLRRYRDIAEEPVVAAQLIFTLRGVGPTTPEGLLAAAFYPVEMRMTALPHLWKLIGERRIRAPLNQPLTMHTPIAYAVEE